MSETKTKTGPSRARDVGVVGVPVADQDRALEFYVGKLRFEVRVDAPMPTGGCWIMLTLPSTTTVVALVAATEHAPAGVETGIRFTTTDAEADHPDMVAAGVDVDEVLQWPGVPPMFKFRDQMATRWRLSRHSMGRLNKQFVATLQKSRHKGAWTYVVMPASVEFFGKRGLVKVRDTATGTRSAAPSWRSATAHTSLRQKVSCAKRSIRRRATASWSASKNASRADLSIC